MNFHHDKTTDLNSRMFMNSLREYGLTQHVMDPTHMRGHVLDVFITRDESTILDSTPIVDNQLICYSKGITFCDHKGIHATLLAQKQQQSFSFRKIREIDHDKFCLDIESRLSEIRSDVPIENMVNLYNERIREVLDDHAPLHEKTAIIRQNAHWFSADLHTLKRNKRKAERTWRRTKLTVHHLIYQESSRSYSNSLTQCKKEFYSNKITECCRDSKKLYCLTNQLMGIKSDPVLPSSASRKDLSENFAEYFQGKIRNIRVSLCKSNASNIDVTDPFHADTSFDGQQFSNFTTATAEEIQKLLMKASVKSCELDPLTTHLLKQCIGSFLLTITSIINKSLTDSNVPAVFKQAIVRPLLKKPGLDKDNLKNYRTVSNLSFISKILEKVVAKQIDAHLEIHQLHDDFQSAYRTGHSTETYAHLTIFVVLFLLCSTYLRLSTL
ncbi:uncharacterized protein LOC134265286 [Saccostrea cucullata]|uniref:uncharacterized protein LOC134265286 n=1 Tax=Saccostrea cuccullata TaxID=36930 RepID=UPI002ED4EE0D